MKKNQLKWLPLFRLNLNRCTKALFQRTICPIQLEMNWNAKRKSAARNSRARDPIVASVRKFSLTSTVSFIFILNGVIFSTAQNQSLELSVGVNRLDYLIGVGVTNHWSKIELRSSFELGVGTTFVQGRLNPRIGIGASYLPLNRDRIVLGPTIAYAYSYVQVNKVEHSYHHWHEFLIGYSFQYGDKWCIVHRGMGSVVNQRFKGQASGTSNGFTNFGFYAQLGLKCSL